MLHATVNFCCFGCDEMLRLILGVLSVFIRTLGVCVGVRIGFKVGGGGRGAGMGHGGLRGRGEGLRWRFHRKSKTVALLRATTNKTCKSVTFSPLPVASIPKAAPREATTIPSSFPISNPSFARSLHSTANAPTSIAANNTSLLSLLATTRKLPSSSRSTTGSSSCCDNLSISQANSSPPLVPHPHDLLCHAQASCARNRLSRVRTAARSLPRCRAWA